jgi:predicted trehalose synthase
MNQAVKQDVAEKVKNEHAALSQKLRRIHAALAETEGFFAAVTAHAPRLAQHADRLCNEHEALLHKADELCRFAVANSPSLTWWRELSTRCHDFSRRLMQHENQESQLLQQAYQEDLGGGVD